ncbi:unnamed protein product [Owenia fusiformis]|uniref:Uncharacterized protein n=1 Tax=Owenia fusiformis TaxID=6347 RepID=A0A8J1UNH4_OWEFU|nr:unnamed protein product [Owenia fusiformis]
MSEVSNRFDALKPVNDRVPDTDSESDIDLEPSTDDISIKDMYTKIHAMFNSLQKQVGDISSRLDFQESKMREIAEEVCKQTEDDLKSDILDIRSDVNGLESRIDDIAKKSPHTGVNDLTSRQLCIRGIQYSQTEHLPNKINAILREDLKLRDITIESAKRLGRNNDSKVVIVTCRTIDDRSIILENKNKLSQSRRNKDVKIFPAKTKSELAHESNLRKLVNTCARDDLIVINGRIVDKRDQRQRNRGHDGFRGNRENTPDGRTSTNRQRSRSPAPTSRGAPRNVNTAREGRRSRQD